jgi:hypothetical protein
MPPLSGYPCCTPHAAAGSQGPVITPVEVLDRDDRATSLELALVVVGLFFRDAQTDESTHQPRNGCPTRRVGQDYGQGSSSDHWADDRNHPRQDPQPHETADAGPCNSTGDGIPGCFRSLLCGVSLVGIGSQYPDLLIAKAGTPQFLHGAVSLLVAFKDTNYRRALCIRHDLFPH